VYLGRNNLMDQWDYKVKFGVNCLFATGIACAPYADMHTIRFHKYAFASVVPFWLKQWIDSIAGR